jgi:hypothetical protein
LFFNQLSRVSKGSHNSSFPTVPTIHGFAPLSAFADGRRLVAVLQTVKRHLELFPEGSFMRKLVMKVENNKKESQSLMR